MQSLKILHHFLVDTTVSLKRWKCYSWFQKAIDWDAFKASSSSLLKVRRKLALMNVWWSTVVSDNMLRQIKEHKTRKEPHDNPQSCCSWKAVTPDIFWVVELISGKHCIWTNELQFTLYISEDNQWQLLNSLAISRSDLTGCHDHWQMHANRVGRVLVTDYSYRYHMWCVIFLSFIIIRDEACIHHFKPESKLLWIKWQYMTSQRNSRVCHQQEKPWLKTFWMRQVLFLQPSCLGGQQRYLTAILKH